MKSLLKWMKVATLLCLILSPAIVNAELTTDIAYCPQGKLLRVTDTTNHVITYFEASGDELVAFTYGNLGPTGNHLLSAITHRGKDVDDPMKFVERHENNVCNLLGKPA